MLVSALDVCLGGEGQNQLSHTHVKDGVSFPMLGIIWVLYVMSREEWGYLSTALVPQHMVQHFICMGTPMVTWAMNINTGPS